MTKEEFLTKIWSYYIMLESNFISTFQYVEPTDENNNVYSKEYCKLLLSIGSEIDVVCKELCKSIENKTSIEVEHYNIINYKNIISSTGNFITETCVNIVSLESITPWKEWSDSNSPTWWKNYNHLKHDRLSNEYYKLGNYSNVKNALAGLYVLCRVLYKRNYSKEPVPKSNLFKISNWEEYTELGNGFTRVACTDGHIAIYSS